LGLTKSLFEKRKLPASEKQPRLGKQMAFLRHEIVLSLAQSPFQKRNCLLTKPIVLPSRDVESLLLSGIGTKHLVELPTNSF